MLKQPSMKLAAALALACSTSLTAQAQDAGALVEALVRKGVLTDQEAEEVRADMTRDFAETSAGKININSSVSQMKLFGDLRVRYQYDNKDAQRDPAGSRVSPTGTQRSRYRFRLRLGAEFQMGASHFGGVELQTSQASDSGNQTYEDGFNDYQIFISKAYFGWNITDYATVTAGKMGNPFYTTDLVWDADINPTGLTEMIAFHKMIGGGAAGPTGYSKDGKTFESVEVASTPDWELTLNAGQFIYDDNAESVVDNDLSTDAYLFQTQLVASLKFDNGVKFTVAPGWLFTNAASLTGFINENTFQDAAAAAGVPAVSGASRDMNILLAPGDVSFKLGSMKAKFYWDFAWNINGRKRAESIYGLAALVRPANGGSQKLVSQHSSTDDFAYLAGIQLGENKKQGDFSLLVNYRQTGIASVDPNLNDSDFALGELNTRGIKTGLAYNFTDFAIGAVTYYYAWNLRDDLSIGQSTFGQAIADSNVVQVLQVDFSIKF